ncbi:MAG: hypothetical protein ACRD9L_14115 [Bryobacteraceae bacterium]
MTTAIEPSAETLKAVNELLKGASTIGAYTLGMVCYEAWTRGVQPPRAILEIAAQSPSLEYAQDLITTLGNSHAAGKEASR